MMIRNFILLICSVTFFFSINILAQELESNDQIKSKVLYAKYKSYPKIVYTKQRFEVVIQADILLDSEQFFNIYTDISPNKNIELITKDIIWYKKNNNFYETSLVFKAKDKSFKFPNIELSLYNKENELIDKEELTLEDITYRKIAINHDRYSNVIASSLNINSIKTRQYTNNQLLSILEISAKNSNLEEFYLNKYTNQGIKEIVANDDMQTLYFYVIIPRHTQDIKFDYYNTIENELVTVEMPIELKEELVSTQNDLNPNETNFEFYKKISLVIIILIFIMLYYFKRRGKYLLLAILFMIFLINMSFPNDKVLLKANEKVYILPTSNSTIFKILTEDEEVEVLIKKNNYKKVLFKNQTIGWVKNGEI